MSETNPERPATADNAQQIVRQLEEFKGDWRIGLSVKPKYRHDPLRYERGKVLAVFPSGYGSIDDANGVLKIEMESGSVILRGCKEWITA